MRASQSKAGYELHSGLEQEPALPGRLEGKGPGKGPVNWVNWFNIAAGAPLLMLSILTFCGEAASPTRQFADQLYVDASLGSEEYCPIGNSSRVSPYAEDWLDQVLGLGRRRYSEKQRPPEYPDLGNPMHMVLDPRTDQYQARVWCPEEELGEQDRLGE